MNAELRWLRTMSFVDERFVKVILDPGNPERPIGDNSPIFTIIYNYHSGYLVNPTKITRTTDVESLGSTWGEMQVIDNLRRSREAKRITEEELENAQKWLALGKTRTTPRYFDLRIRR